MAGKMSWIFCCIVARFVGTCTAVDRIQLEKQLFGFRMCQHFCQQVSGCHVLTYFLLSLSCRIGVKYDPAYSDANNPHIFNVAEKDNLNLEGDKRCRFGYILMQSRAGLYQCVSYRIKRKGQEHKGPVMKDYLKMTPDVYDLCQKVYQFCDSGEGNLAREQLFKLCAKSKRTDCGLLSKFFRQNECHLSEASSQKFTVLHTAAKGGFLHVAKCALSEGRTSLDREDKYGRTPIMVALAAGMTEMFNFLLNVGSDLTIADDKGRSVLHLACRYGRVDILENILQEGYVSLHTTTIHGCTPIMTAVKYGKRGFFKRLLEKGSSLYDVDDDGSNLLHIAATQSNSKLFKDILGRQVADIESEDNTGRTPLMMAALCHQRSAFNILLQHNASLRVVDSAGNNLLHAACKGGDKEIVKTVIKHMNNHELMTKNNEGKTPLAVAKRHGELIHILKQML